MAVVFNPYEIAGLVAAGLVTSRWWPTASRRGSRACSCIALYAVIGIVYYVA